MDLGTARRRTVCGITAIFGKTVLPAVEFFPAQNTIPSAWSQRNDLIGPPQFVHFSMMNSKLAFFRDSAGHISRGRGRCLLPDAFDVGAHLMAQELWPRPLLVTAVEDGAPVRLFFRRILLIEDFIGSAMVMDLRLKSAFWQ